MTRETDRHVTHGEEGGALSCWVLLRVLRAVVSVVPLSRSSCSCPAALVRVRVSVLEEVVLVTAAAPLQMAAAEAAAPQQLTLRVSHGRETLDVQLASDATVAALKDLLAARTGALARNTKLIHKGRVLVDSQRLAACGVGDGARLMMLTASVRRESCGSHATARHCTHAAATLWQSAPPPASGVARTAPRQPSTSPAAVSLDAAAARRAAWAKTGSVALRDAQLQEVPPEVWAVGDAVRVLDVSGNPQLGSVNAQLAQLVALTRLHACGCGLNTDAVAWDSLCGLRNLRTLSLDGNGLTTLPEALGQLPLTHLSVASNKLTALPASIGRLTALVALNVAHNALSELPEQLGNCCELEVLNAEHNLLTALPASLGECKRLAVLTVDSNRLSAAGLPPALLRAPALHTLSVHNNPVTVEQLREVDGYKELDARRRAKAEKAIGGRVLGASSAFDEGADAAAFRKF